MFSCSRISEIPILSFSHGTGARRCQVSGANRTGNDRFVGILEVAKDAIDRPLRFFRATLATPGSIAMAQRALSWKAANLLLVAPRSRHVGFLLDAVEAWFGLTTSPELWIAAGVG